MVRKKTKVSRKKVASRKPSGILHSVVSWVREKAGMAPYSTN
jgi:hypothetical protein